MLNQIRPYWIFLLLLLPWHSLFAQTNSEGPFFFSPNVLSLYFLMLLFATIINRLLEYLKLFVLVIDRRLMMFKRMGDFIFASIKQKMDGLGIYYDPEKVRSRLRKYMLFAVMQLLAFGMGIVLAVVFKLNVLSEMAIPPKSLFGYVITGLIMGAGVDPVHAFFRIVQEKRKIKKLLNQAENQSD